MPRIGIIGSAGRKDDRQKVTKQRYESARQHIQTLISREQTTPLEGVTLVSGGAAFIDHIAVQLYLDRKVDHLVLHLPSMFQNSQFLGKNWNSPGKIANHYHGLFSRKLGISSLREIQKAIHLGAEIYCHSGFFTRNLEVGRVDTLIAMTFGTQSGTYTPEVMGWHDALAAGLKPGGTSHTWNNSPAPHKIHIDLSTF